MKRYKNTTIILLLCALYVFIYKEWIFTQSILTSGDWVFFFRETLTTLRIHYFSLWLGDYSFGRALVDVSQAPTFALYGYLSKLFGLEYSHLLRVVHLWPILIFTPLSIYILLTSLVRNKAGVLVGVLLYTFNTYFLILQTGVLTLMAAYSLAPLVIFAYIKSINNNNVFFAVLSGFLLFICSAYETRAAYIIIWVLFFYFVYSFWMNMKKYSYKKILKRALIGITPIVVLVLLSMYWILGLSQLGILVENDIFSRSLFGNEFLNLLYAFTIYHPFWTGELPAIFEIQPIPLYQWIIPILVILGIYFNRKSRSILFFGFLLIIGLLLTKQVGHPFSSLYEWLYMYVPGFNAFREASKFYFIIILCYSVIIAAFFDWLWEKKNTRLELGKYILLSTVVCIFLLNTVPILTGKIGTMFTPRHIPQDYLVFKDFLLTKNNYSRTLWFPTSSRWSFHTNVHPIVPGIVEINGFWAKYVDEERSKNKFYEAELLNILLDKPYANNLLDMSSVEYLVIPKEDKENEDNFYVHYRQKKDYYIKALDNKDYLTRVDIGTKELLVYENSGFKPHIYITDVKEDLDKRIEYTSIDSTFVSPTQYVIVLSKINKPRYIHFSEKYHPQWRVRIGEFSKFRSIFDSKYFLNSNYHLKNVAGLNSYYIDPAEVCKIYNCKKNPDGSFDITMTLYFQPQSYLFVGGIISGLTFLAILVYILNSARVKILKKVRLKI